MWSKSRIIRQLMVLVMITLILGNICPASAVSLLDRWNPNRPFGAARSGIVEMETYSHPMVGYNLFLTPTAGTNHVTGMIPGDVEWGQVHALLGGNGGKYARPKDRVGFAIRMSRPGSSIWETLAEQDPRGQSKLDLQDRWSGYLSVRIRFKDLPFGLTIIKIDCGNPGDAIFIYLNRSVLTLEQMVRMAQGLPPDLPANRGTEIGSQATPTNGTSASTPLASAPLTPSDVRFVPSPDPEPELAPVKPEDKSEENDKPTKEKDRKKSQKTKQANR